MGNNMKDFLEALKENTDTEVKKIHSGAKPVINKIYEKNRSEIAMIQEEQSSGLKSLDLLESFQRELSTKQLEWVTKVNNEQGKLLEQLFSHLLNRFQALSEDKGIYEISGKLYDEVKADTGDDFVVHISHNCSPERFKSKTGITHRVFADLDEVGVVIERKDVPITVENTLEGRMTKIRGDLEVMASQGLWGDLDITPWDVNQVLDKLLKLSS